MTDILVKNAPKKIVALYWKQVDYNIWIKFPARKRMMEREVEDIKVNDYLQSKMNSLSNLL